MHDHLQMYSRNAMTQKVNLSLKWNSRCIARASCLFFFVYNSMHIRRKNGTFEKTIYIFATMICFTFSYFLLGTN